MINITQDDELNKKLKWLEEIDTEQLVFTGRSYEVVKRILDLTVVLSSLPFWVPVIACAALAIKISEPHLPVFYKGMRTGKGGSRFLMYKLRTMVPNADEIKEQLKHMNELVWPDFKIKTDPRVTKVGRVIRKFSIDEIPQLFNVIKGDMSMVGPRPTFIKLADFKLWQTKRLEATPGITGLWQIIGRGSSLFETRIRLDIAYIEKQCLWLDVQILFRTIKAVISQRGSF